MMTLEDDLSNKKWPKPPFEIRPPSAEPSERERMLSDAVSEYDRSAYVREGRVVLRHLGWKGVVKPMPPGESAITSLARDPRGRILGATSGSRTHAFIYDPEVDRVVDLGAVDEDSTAKNSVVVTDDGVVYLGTRKSAGPGKLLSFKTDYRETLSWEPSSPKFKVIDLPKRNEGIACLSYDRNRRCVYGITSHSGTFFMVDAKSHSPKLVGQVDELGDFSDCLVVGCNGRVYGGKRWGKMYEFNPETGDLAQLDLEIPSIAGRQLYNRVDSMALDEPTGKLYGGGTADGVVFCLDTTDLRIISLGKPTPQARVRAIAVGKDHRVYGISGRRGGTAHLFRYDPCVGELHDLGIPVAYSDQYWHGYEFDSMATGKDGEIYMGESDRISHLFIYYPPIG